MSLFTNFKYEQIITNKDVLSINVATSAGNSTANSLIEDATFITRYQLNAALFDKIHYNKMFDKETGLLRTDLPNFTIDILKLALATYMSWQQRVNENWWDTSKVDATTEEDGASNHITKNDPNTLYEALPFGVKELIKLAGLYDDILKGGDGTVLLNISPDEYVLKTQLIATNVFNDSNVDIENSLNVAEVLNFLDAIDKDLQNQIDNISASGSSKFKTGEYTYDVSIEQSLTNDLRLPTVNLMEDSIFVEKTERMAADNALDGRVAQLETGGNATFNTGQKVSSLSIVGTDSNLDTSLTVDGKVNVEKLRNDSQDISISENSNNIIALNELINVNLLYANRLTNGTNTLITTTPVNLPLPNVNADGIFETLDGGISYDLKAGKTLKAGTIIYWEQTFNFTLSNVSTTDRGILTSYINATPYNVKEIDLTQNQTNGSFYVKNIYTVPVDTTTLNLTSKAVATNGNFNAILLANSYVLITAQNNNGVVATTTDNITYKGNNPLLAGLNQTQMDDRFQNDKADVIALNLETTNRTDADTNLQTQINLKQNITDADAKYYQIGNVPNPVNDGDAVNKAYLDSFFNSTLIYSNRFDTTAQTYYGPIDISQFRDVYMTVTTLLANGTISLNQIQIKRENYFTGGVDLGGGIFEYYQNMNLTKIRIDTDTNNNTISGYITNAGLFTDVNVEGLGLQ